MILDKQGGLCFELSELAYFALKQVGFDVNRVPAYVTFTESFDIARSKESAHNILIVNLDNKQYLIEVGSTDESHRYPIEFIPESTYEVQLND